LHFFAAASKTRSEKEKMLAGELYFAGDSELLELRNQARLLCREFNKTSPRDEEVRNRLLSELFGQKLDNVFIEPPLHCDYGKFITFGKNVFMNFNTIILDVCHVKIGDDTLFGPSVQLLAATHPLDVDARVNLAEYGKPITIGKACWVGGGVVFCPGVTIGDNVAVAAGAVVTKNFPSNCVIGGNPARIFKPLEPMKESK
jgi:maltose O-acetyltransferase